MVDANVSEEEYRTASLNHAQLLFQAAINLARMGRRETALSLVLGAQKRFENFNETADAVLARTWANGLQKRVQKDKLAAPIL